MIKLTNVCYSYESKEPVLKSINLEIKKGEFVSIMGHNGSGKTTLVKQFNGLLLPTSGTITVNGLDTRTNFYQIRRFVGMVFSYPDNQIVGETVIEDITFGLENLCMSPININRRIDEILSYSFISPYRNSYIYTLSESKKQKVVIASILAMEPSYLILDDAISILDTSSQEEIFDFILTLRKDKGMTIIQVTHTPEDALLGERIVIMKDGMIILDGSSTSVFNQLLDMPDVGVDVPLIFKLNAKLPRGPFRLKVTTQNLGGIFTTEARRTQRRK